MPFENPPPSPVESSDNLVAETAAALERIRAEKRINSRGALICGQIMGQMIQIGWRKDQLDALEILFWQCRDGNGEVIKPNNPSNL